MLCSRNYVASKLQPEDTSGAIGFLLLHLKHGPKCPTGFS